MMIGRGGLIGLALLLGVAAGLRDGFDDWVDATELPPVLVETSAEVRDRNGALLRVFPVENGRVRLAVSLGPSFAQGRRRCAMAKSSLAGQP